MQREDWREFETSAATLGGGVDDWVSGDGVRLHCVSAGEGPLVLLLHGFPDFWFGWRHQLPALAAAGYRAVALDLRGYNLSDRPPRVEDYALERVTADVAAVIQRLGGPARAVVGHDWGGVVAWRLSRSHPASFDRLVAMNAPHPKRYRELLRRPAQVIRSWYAAAVQIPALPEWLLRRNDAAGVAAIIRAEHARRGAVSERELDAYRAAFRRNDALRAALAYYRAAARAPRRALGAPTLTTQPTLVVWGMRDGALVPANADGLERWVPDLRIVRVPRARHFVQSDAPDVVNDALLAFLAGRSVGQSALGGALGGASPR
jgi:pimeloyl-ACP methyl ester carboxylesterase